MLSTTLLSALWLFCGTCGSDGRDLIRGFPADGPQAWTMSHRSGLWTQHSASTEMLRIIDENTLEFPPFPGDRLTAVLASQYLYPKEPIRGKLRLETEHLGTEASKVRINIDIQYHNGTTFHIDKPLRDTARTCFVIPDYGTIRALMVHIILEQKTEMPIQIKEFLLTTQEQNLHDLDCTLYARSYPYYRQTIYNFLVPKRAMDGSDSHRITVTTQLTFDRYPLLEEMVTQWRGPLSVVFFALDTDSKVDEVEEFTKRYQENPLLHTYATIHLVYPDQRNGADEKQLPINYLRNVALQGAGTRDVFLLDIGTLPAFTSKQATSWVDSARATENCDKCVFIAPLFDAVSLDTHIPNSKKNLVEALDAGQVKNTGLASHSIVPLSTWKESDQVLKVDYRENMEPYFIAGPTAPLINEMYVGYGRDKCAYSSDVFHTGHHFHVLPNAFLIRKKIPNNRSILQLSGINLRMFTNIAFHLNDIKHGHFRYRSDAITSKLDTQVCTAGVCVGDEDFHDTNKYTVKLQRSINTKVNESDSKSNMAPVSSNTSHDKCQKWSHTHFVKTEIIDYVSNFRDDMILEFLIKLYNVGIIIIISPTWPPNFLTYIHFNHPDAVVLISQNDGIFREERLNDFTVTLYGKANISSKLAHARQKYPGPAIIWNMSSDKGTQILVNKGQEGDILVIPNSEASNALLEKLCVTHVSWRIHTYKDKLFIKSLNTTKHPLVHLPPSPNLISEPIDAHAAMVDIILLTKNRPLQTLAFLKSLTNQVTGINKVYVQYVADDKEFEEGYKLVVDCVSNLDIVLVPENTKGFRNVFLSIFEASEASHIMLAVDELIWIRPVDLRMAADLLHRNRDTTAAFQLRLGEDQMVYKRITNTNHIFKDIYPEQDVMAFYPLRLPYDFGYLMHVDGLLMSKADMFRDFSETMIRYFDPSSLENGWMKCCLQPRARQWHLMYKTSRVFNNILQEDIRVAKMTSPGQNNYNLTKRLVVDKTEINVEELTKSVVGQTISTHMRRPVSYTALTCTWRCYWRFCLCNWWMVIMSVIAVYGLPTHFSKQQHNLI